MAGVGDEHWTERPKIRLEKELGKERFNNQVVLSGIQGQFDLK